MEDKKRQYSFSRLSTYLDCQYAYYLNYIARAKQLPNVYTKYGTATHNIVESLQEGLIDIKRALEELDNCEVDYTMDNIKFINDKVKNNFFNSIRHYIEYFTPFEYKKMRIEQSVKGEIAGFRIGGYVDLIGQNEDVTMDVVDFKSSTKYGKKDLVKYGRQLIIYAMLLERAGCKINRIGWDFIKHAVITWKGQKRTKTIQRHKLIEEYQNRIMDELKNLGLPSVECDMIIEKALKSNDIRDLPIEIQAMFKIDRCFVEYPFNDETKADAERFITEQILDIERKEQIELGALCAIEDIWKPKEITIHDNFFCSQLCGFRDDCPAYAKFIKDNADNFKSKVDSLDDEFNAMMGG